MDLAMTAGATGRSWRRRRPGRSGRGRWKRYRAVLLLAAGQRRRRWRTRWGAAVASVYGWAARWRADGVAGLREGRTTAGAAPLDAAGEALLAGLLARDPQAHGHQATGWTVPLLRTELAAGRLRGRRTDRPPRLHRLGYRWKRPQYVLGRPDPAYDRKKGAVIAAAAATLAAGGEVWVADETGLREFPPLRAGWSKRGVPAIVPISGRNARRTILGALNVSDRRVGAHGARAVPHRRRARRGGDAGGGAPGGAQAAGLGQRPASPPPPGPRRGGGGHHPGLPPLPLPGADAVGRPVAGPKQTVAANRGYASLEDLVARALDLAGRHERAERLRRCGFEASKFEWLAT